MKQYSYRCDHCDRLWPYTGQFSTCPICKVRARTSTVGVAMSLREAEMELRRFRFAQHYRRREAARSGPSPEELGRRDAREILELEARFRAA